MIRQSTCALPALATAVPGKKADVSRADRQFPKSCDMRLVKSTRRSAGPKLVADFTARRIAGEPCYRSQPAETQGYAETYQRRQHFI